MSNFSDLDLAGIRAARTALQAQEDAVSFVRRMAQGRLDIARDEQRRRAENLPTSNTATDLAGVFGQEHGGGSARPPRETNIATDHPLVIELDSCVNELALGQFALSMLTVCRVQSTNSVHLKMHDLASADHCLMKSMH